MNRFLIIFSLTFLFLVSPCFAYQENSVTMFIPAVEKTDYGYHGVLATLTVYIKSGDGHVFVDTLPLTEIDTQASARIAKESAEELLNTNLDDYDLFFVIRSDAPIVGGPSAGGAMAVGLISALLNLTIDNSVVMTGTINSDGSIGPVGSLMEKAQAVAENNGTIFLIPEGQSIIQTQQTEKTETPSGVSIVSEPVKINLKDYAKEKWNLTVIEVEDAKKAAEYMTHYRFEIKEVKIDKSDALQMVMKDMATDFISEIKEKLNKTKDLLKSASLSYQYEQQLQKTISEQEKELEEIEDLYKNEKYYSASSHCFIASIQLTYAENTIKLIESKNKENFLNKELTDVKNKIDKIADEINTEKLNVDNVSDIEVIAVSSERIDDANSYLKNAWKSFYNSEYFDSVYLMSYAEERANTAKKWLDLTQKFSGEKIDFNFTQLKDLAQLRITDALSSATYANLLGANASEAEELLESARNNYENGLYSSALFNAVMAKAQVDIILGTTGLDNEEIKNKVEIIEKEAMKKIQESQVYGALPVMAMNYYEYGLSFKEDSPTTALIYLVYAKHFARVSKNLLEVFEGKYFGFQTENITITPNHYVTATETKIEYYAITLTAGAVLGFITGISIKRKKRRIR